MALSRDAYFELIKQFPLRPLRSERDLDQAIQIVDRLAVRKSLDRSERDYLDVLADLIERYEDRHHEIEPLADGEMLRFLIEQSGRSQIHLAHATGIANSTISAVMSGKRDLTRRQVAKLSAYFHVDPGIFPGARHGSGFLMCWKSASHAMIRNLCLPNSASPALLSLLATAGPAASADDKRDKLNQRFDDEIAQFTDQIEKSPKSVDLYSRRGDAYFFRGKFSEAVADYEKMVELQPDLETSHWRKGIAYFYAKRYKDAATQFENYHQFDNVDRENGIWRYLSQTKALGREKAREGLLKYEKEDREPFPEVYRLFSGELTGDEVVKRINDAKILPREREQRLFYAELYVGLNDFVEGRLESAETHLEAAAKNNWGAKAGGGPGYMWHVARVHHDLLVAERRESKKYRATHPK